MLAQKSPERGNQVVIRVDCVELRIVQALLEPFVVVLVPAPSGFELSVALAEFFQRATFCAPFPGVAFR